MKYIFLPLKTDIEKLKLDKFREMLIYIATNKQRRVELEGNLKNNGFHYSKLGTLRKLGYIGVNFKGQYIVKFHPVLISDDDLKDIHGKVLEYRRKYIYKDRTHKEIMCIKFLRERGYSVKRVIK